MVQLQQYLLRKDSRNKLKAEYNKYKQDPQTYKNNAKDKATQLGTIANETIKKLKITLKIMLLD